MKLKYELIGNPRGRSIVCLHGFLESNDMWKEGCLENLPHHFVLIELPGHHAESEILPDSLNIADMVKPILNILDKLSINNFDIIGHSLGGYIAIEVCKQKSSFEKLILLNSNFWSDSEIKKEERVRIAQLVQTKLVGFINEVVPNLFQQKENCQLQISSIINKAKRLHPKNVAALTNAMKDRTDNTEWIKTNQKKIVFIQGEKDTVMPTAVSTQMCKTNGIKLIEIPDSGHMTAYENTRELNIILENAFNLTLANK